MTETRELAAKLGNELLGRKHRLVTAESCTGGGIAHAITDIPGSSQWFDCGFVTYSNDSKIRLLHIPEILIHQHGAVSGEVAVAMAKSALAAAGNGTISIAATGIAGPDGATPAKPMGTVWFGLAGNDQVFVEHRLFSGGRHTVRHQAVRHALEMLIRFLGFK